MSQCKYCGEEFENQGYLMSHAKVCPKNPKNKDQVRAKVSQKVDGETYILVSPEEYDELRDFKELSKVQEQLIKGLEAKIQELETRPTVNDGKVFWPVSKLPEEVKLLMDGQFLSLKCIGRLHGDIVEIEDAKLL